MQNGRGVLLFAHALFPHHQLEEQFYILVHVFSFCIALRINYTAISLLKMSAVNQNSRLKSYKNKGLDAEELRRRREEEGVQLRKAKREEHVCFVKLCHSFILVEISLASA